MKKIQHPPFGDDDGFDAGRFSHLGEELLMGIHLEMSEKIKAAAQYHSLNRLGINVSYNLMFNFLKTESDLTEAEVQHLEDISVTDQEAPAKLLQRIMSKEIRREDMLGYPKNGDHNTAE